MRFITLPDGRQMPKLGQGTWTMGESAVKQQKELEALNQGLAAGMTLIDTAEMYGEGASEQLIADVIENKTRAELFLVSKVYPHNAGRNNIFQSCEASLKRLGTDYLDLYLLHWRGRIPLTETVDCLEALKAQGKIKGWGVSNFDTADMEELLAIPKGKNCQVNQVLYHLGSRGIEFDLLPLMETYQIPVMAYCPIAQGGGLKRELYSHPVLKQIAEKYGITITQLLLAFVLKHNNIMAIPKAGNPVHTIENSQAVQIILQQEDINELDNYFPIPKRKIPLDIV